MSRAQTHGIRRIDAHVFSVDPSAVVSPTQYRSPQQATCDRSPWNDDRPQMPNLLIGRSLPGGHDPKNVVLACINAQHCGSTVRPTYRRHALVFNWITNLP